MYFVYKQEEPQFDAEKVEIFRDILMVNAEIFACTASNNDNAYYTIYRSSQYHSPDYMCVYHSGQKITQRG